MSKKEMQTVSKQVLALMRQEDKRHRTAAIQALQPALQAYATGRISAEEYEAFVGESYAQTLTRKFSYELQDARDAVKASIDNGLATNEEMAELMRRLDAAGCPPEGNGTTLAETVRVPVESDEGQGEAEEVQ